MVRDGKAQTWLKAGATTNTERTIAAIAGNTITVDVPLSDSFDSQYLNPPGTAVVKIKPPAGITQSGIEDLHIECPPQAINHTQPHFQALRISGHDCWARDVVIDETMNSVGVSGSRITLLRVAVNRKAEHQGSSKPAEFAPNGSQVLMDRCSVNADNVWFSATGSSQAGPIVLLNCTFHGKGSAESHQRWSTGMLYDNCRPRKGKSKSATAARWVPATAGRWAGAWCGTARRRISGAKSARRGELADRQHRRSPPLPRGHSARVRICRRELSIRNPHLSRRTVCIWPNSQNGWGRRR